MSRAERHGPERMTARPPRSDRRASTGQLKRPIGNRAMGRLLLGAPETASERQADRVADAVIEGRTCRAPSGAARPGTRAMPAAVESEIHHARGAGRPLSGPVQQRLQRTMSADLSAVRIHTDDRAHRISKGIGAEAATAGRDIFFRRGRYRPSTRDGLNTVAHEVAHTLQRQDPRGGPEVVQRRLWFWRPGRRDPAHAWRDDQQVSPEVLEQVGEGQPGDRFDDQTHVYTPFDPKLKDSRGEFGKLNFDRDRFVPPPDLLDRYRQRDALRETAGTTLAGCDTLDKLASHLDAAGYNCGTVPDAYLDATEDFTRFKAKKTFSAAPRARQACRLALRDLSLGREPGADPATRYMELARRREKATDKSIGMAGKFTWDAFDAGGSDTDFGKWALGKTWWSPVKSSTMNCWESVLYRAHKAGFLPRAQIETQYEEMGRIMRGEADPREREGDGPRPTSTYDLPDDDFMIPLEQLLTKGPPRAYDPHDPNTERPLKGDIVVYQMFSKHVAVAEGNTGGEPQVVSLYNTPNRVDSVQRVPISSFMEGVGYRHYDIWLYRPFWA